MLFLESELVAQCEDNGAVSAAVVAHLVRFGESEMVSQVDHESAEIALRDVGLEGDTDGQREFRLLKSILHLNTSVIAVAVHFGF